MKSTIAIRFAVFAAGLALIAAARADILAAWDMSGVNASGTPVFTNTTSAAGITSNSTTLSLGSGVTPSATANTFGGTTFTANNLSGAVSSNDYLSWTIQADPGNLITITNVSWNFQRTTTGGSNLTLVSSYDGFTTDVFGLTNFTGAAGGGDANFAVTTISGSNSVEFRIYAYNAADSAGVDRFRNLAGNDLVVQGTITAIPEPASMLLFGTGVGVLGLIRRRRHAAN